MNLSSLQNGSRNCLLSLLPEHDLKQVVPVLERVPVRVRQVLIQRYKPISHIYFPCNVVASILADMNNGTAVEIGTVGNEGMTSITALLGGRIATDTLIVQIPGDCLRMPLERFLTEVESSATFRHILQLYAQAYLSQITQSLACNRLHAIEQRFARWLLMTMDRVGDNHFNITHELLSIMLGCNRPSLSTVAKQFQDAGLIQYNRGKMTLLDRAIMEETSCECYLVVRKQFERLLGMHMG